MLFGAAVASLALAFDPRYRDFPLAIVAPPAVTLALLAWIASASAEVEEHTLAAALVVAAPIIALREGLANTDALAWVALCLALAASVWQRRAPGTAPARSAPAAARRHRSRPRTARARGAEAGGGERPR